MPVHVLQARDQKTGRCVFSQLVAANDIFSLRYTHSVKQKYTWDIYTVDKNYHIVQTATVSPGTGYGLPCITNLSEKFSITKDGYFKISNMQRPVESLALRVGKAYDNILEFNSTSTVNFSQTFGSGVLLIGIYETNLFNHWRGS